MIDAAELSQSLQTEAERLGFVLSGIAPARSAATMPHLEKWLDEEMHGEMHYLQTRRDAYRHPRSVSEKAISIMMMAVPYCTQPPVENAQNCGRIARYAWGNRDYHDVIHHRLKQLCKHAQSIDESIVTRGVVDTAPLLEREFAQQAGLGWAAKNTMLINKSIGSYFFLCALLVNRELIYDMPFTADHCGTCQACIEACPTDAFVAPHVLDARKCVSYLTIEHRSPVPLPLRAGMQNWILGCDICQEVCPWNRKAPVSSEADFLPLPDHNPLSLLELFDLDDEQFRARFRKTPLWRPKRRGILRNAAIALGNQAANAQQSTRGKTDPALVAALVKGLEDSEPLVRGASAWALRQVNDATSDNALTQRRVVETDPYVILEIDGNYDDQTTTVPISDQPSK